ncbi:MAG: NAD(P)-binding domain-containing protein [Gemmataceae bacterium]|nr:NAD(P)-binding domain-containing protein [Gemmata sp.]MDW8199195.1 NAD(P)-binding domain-containing protein [Gemmataceae bacterium]
MAKFSLPRVAIVGAGPIGMEAALYAKACGLPVSVYERGEVGDHLRQWGYVRMFTPFGWNVTPLGLAELRRIRGSRDFPQPRDSLTGQEFLESYLRPLAECETLRGSLHWGHTVWQIGRTLNRTKAEVSERGPFRLLVTDANGQERIAVADVVLDCTGTWGHPNSLGDGGIAAVGERAARPHIAWGLEDICGPKRAHYAGRSIALIGDGYSAATTISALAELADEFPETWVFWISNGPRGAPLPRIPQDPLKERDRLAVRANALATRGDGNLEFHPQTVIDEVICHNPEGGFRIAGRSAGRPVVWEVERIIANVGYSADLGLCRGLLVDPPDRKPETREPGYYILGVKSYGRYSGFLLRDGFEQIRRVFAQIMGQSRLDLYAHAA